MIDRPGMLDWSKATRKRRWARRVLQLGVIVCVAGAGYLAYALRDLPDPVAALGAQRATTITVLDRHGELVGRRGAGPGEYAPLDTLPPVFVEAVVTVEDRRFYRHMGVDLAGMARAAMANVAARRVVQGGSTLTQQLARHLFLTPERSIKRKLQEITLALWLERRFTKDEILELYLNRVYFGAGAWGVHAAAQRYFGQTPSEMTVAEAALLAGLLQAPSRYSPALAPRRAEDRTTLVVNMLARQGVISRAQRAAAFAQPIVVKRSSDTALAGHFVDWVAQEALTLIPTARDDGVTPVALTVKTTLDLSMQAAADAAFARVMTDEIAARGATQAALVAMEGDGAVRALAGGVNYRASQFNRAVQARRQPGSAFKTFVYTAALERGLRPADVRIDAPITVETWSPRNYKDEYRGPVTLLTAFTRSLNSVAVSVSEEIDRRNVAATARRLGIASPLPATPAMALGAYEVSLLELTAAYAPFANRGYRVAPYAITAVRGGAGQTYYTHTPPPAERALDDETRRRMTAMMASVMADGTGRAARPGRPAAGKTGTTNDHRDAWFVGFIPGFIAGVWVGDDDFASMDEVVGGGVPARLWSAFLREAVADVEPRALDATDLSAPTEALAVMRAGRGRDW